MNDREKLIALMDAAREHVDFECDKRDGCSGCPNDSRNEFCLTPYMVDHLLANGVVVREKGEWLPCGFGREIMCSVCRCELDDVWEHRYCPDCGADMRGVKCK